MALSSLRKFGLTAPKAPFADSKHTNQSRIQLVIFDLGGTVIIPYCYIPEMAFAQTFKTYDITLAPEIIRGPMGKNKLDHMKELFALPELVAQWKKKYGKPPLPTDVESAYKVYAIIQDQLLLEQAEYIPRAKEAFAHLKLIGVDAAATTGFHKSTTNKLGDKLKLKDHFKYIVSGDEVAPSSRAAMIRKVMEEHGVSQKDRDKVVFVTDARGDVANVKNELPGIHVVGAAGFGTHMEVSNETEARALTKASWQLKVPKAAKTLGDAGADAVMTHLGELPRVLASYNKQLVADAVVESRMRSKL